MQQGNQAHLVPDMSAYPPQYAFAPPYFQYSPRPSEWSTVSTFLPDPLRSHRSSLNPSSANPPSTAPCDIQSSSYSSNRDQILAHRRAEYLYAPQIGLDGIRMLDLGTTRTLIIYPLETITRWEVNDPSIYTFWAKRSVDVEPRRIKLKSNTYTTSRILDIVTAATVQLKEIQIFKDSNKSSEQPIEKRSCSFMEWITLVKLSAEEKQHWVPDEAVTKCTACSTDFGVFVRRHHCRNCGDIFCDKCTQGSIALTADKESQPVRACDRCLAEVTQRLSDIREISSKPTIEQSHEDLARKLQEEMDKNWKATTDSDRDSGSPHLRSKRPTPAATGKRMKDVACPTCGVHLQVQVPRSGSETVECGLCQHLFHVSAR